MGRRVQKLDRGLEDKKMSRSAFLKLGVRAREIGRMILGFGISRMIVGYASG